MIKITNANNDFNRVVFFIIIIVIVIVLVSNIILKKDPCDKTNNCEEHTITTKNKWSD